VPAHQAAKRRAAAVVAHDYQIAGMHPVVPANTVPGAGIAGLGDSRLVHHDVANEADVHKSAQTLVKSVKAEVGQLQARHEHAPAVLEKGGVVKFWLALAEQLFTVLGTEELVISGPKRKVSPRVDARMDAGKPPGWGDGARQPKALQCAWKDARTHGSSVR